jgi:hypothetical protein
VEWLTVGYELTTFCPDFFVSRLELNLACFLVLPEIVVMVKFHVSGFLDVKSGGGLAGLNALKAEPLEVGLNERVNTGLHESGPIDREHVEVGE